MSETSKDGFYMKIFRVGPNDDTPQGGVGIFIKSPRLEEITRSLHRATSQLVVEGPVKFYNFGQQALVPDYRGDYQFSLEHNHMLWDGNSDTYFLYPLLMVGISEGSVLMVPGVHPRNLLEAYAKITRKVVSHIWKQFLKPITLELTTTNESMLDVAP